MPADLAAKSCVPCRGGIPPLSHTDAEALRQSVPDWALLDGSTRIERRYVFEDFKDAFAFVSGVAEIAETEGHHPDISFGWGFATVSVFTHKIKGLHENDFVLAAKCDRLFEAGATSRP